VLAVRKVAAMMADRWRMGISYVML